MKPDFDKAQNAATNLLLQQEIRSLYIDVRNFKLPDHIYIDSIQKYCSMTGIPSSKLQGKNIDGACLVKAKKTVLFFMMIQLKMSNANIGVSVMNLAMSV